MAEIDYKEQAKAFAIGQNVRGEDYASNLGQLNNHAIRVSQMYEIALNEAFDNLILAVKLLDEEGFDPLSEFANDIKAAKANY